MSDVNSSQGPANAESEGQHPFQLAAAEGYGPLSPRAKEVWHGESTPCVSCGLLNPREGSRCQHCHQDLAHDMLEKMAKHSGPWFVFDTVRPFPGVSLERLLLQIKRGLLTRTTVVRGPTTFYQWRFAGESPILSKFLGCCWNCQGAVVKEERYCPKCKAVLDGYHRAEQLSSQSPPEAAMELERLGQAVDGIEPTPSVTQDHASERPLGKVLMIVFVIATALVLGIVGLVSLSKPDRAVSPSEVSHGFIDPASSAIIAA